MELSNNQDYFSFPRKGEIWLVDYSYNFNTTESKNANFEVESQIKKIRPSIIISNNLQNQFDKEIFVIPITSIETSEVDDFFEIYLAKNDLNNLSKASKILVKSLRPISKKFRLKKYCGKIELQMVEKIEKTIKVIFGLS